MAPKLSSTQTQALALMDEHGALHRLPGGFWLRPGATSHSGETWFTVQTLQALVDRGLCEFLDYRTPSMPVVCRRKR